MTFSSFSFDKRIDACVKACGYESPTPIQRQAIPLILQGHDVLGLAQTGTGKTAAFALPILQRLISSRSPRNASKVLVLAPTRELALQINENFTALSRDMGIRSCIVIGGVGMEPQIRACKSSQIIVACPGRLVRLIARNAVHLNAIDTLVLDEADRMLDMGFLPDIKRVLAKLPAKRQNLLFSATMPKSIRSFADRILNNPKTVKIDTATPVASIEHTFYSTHNKNKAALLEDLIKRSEHQSMLIFTRTKHKAKNLSRKLSQIGHDSTFLQGNMSQGQREKALNGFRTGQFSIMVATDIAARGIDCDRITHVINYDMPDTVETYTHRIGRTGRAGRAGNAISLVTQDDADQMRALQRMLKISIEQPACAGVDGAETRFDEKSAAPQHKKPKNRYRGQRRKSQRRPEAA
ncbi:DEAD/DEAH box helicase [Pseudodesulfovibrio cashew]|uniref:DEAD-box ATP-dependent RNA helicase RhpA n=1 Tax=Pseudodesulfovibrio cashew TaxID=2678688 RepID=A0A6I6JE79_9BACT|nr:DEAD/DEAH box helicase [Pseudodesulfovibrio cashew]QGY38933.1 DEAD/DEAH box helicase [Pseudodesulfovibrio cashew]